jgi:hypothetical protein
MNRRARLPPGRNHTENFEHTRPVRTQALRIDVGDDGAIEWNAMNRMARLPTGRNSYRNFMHTRPVRTQALRIDIRGDGVIERNAMNRGAVSRRAGTHTEISCIPGL